MEKELENLYGKSKKEVIAIFGEQFNFLPASEWTYELKRSFFFRKVLYLYFDDKHQVTDFKLKSYFSFF